LHKNTKSTALGYYITLQQISTKACGTILCDCNEVSKILNIITVNFIFVFIIRHAQLSLPKNLTRTREKSIRCYEGKFHFCLKYTTRKPHLVYSYIKMDYLWPVSSVFFLIISQRAEFSQKKYLNKRLFWFFLQGLSVVFSKPKENSARHYHTFT